MSEPVSAEVAAMQEKERRRWLTVAEAQSVRQRWSATREALDKAACFCPECRDRARRMRRTRRVGGTQATPKYETPPERLFHSPSTRRST